MSISLHTLYKHQQENKCHQPLFHKLLISLEGKWSSGAILKLLLGERCGKPDSWCKRRASCRETLNQHNGSLSVHWVHSAVVNLLSVVVGKK